MLQALAMMGFDAQWLRVMNLARSSSSSNVMMSMLRVSHRNSSKVSRITFAVLGFSARENSSRDPMTSMLLAFLVRDAKASVPALL
jgi:hypothetical protein